MRKIKGIHSIDSYACSSGLRGVNPAFKVMTAVGTICVVIAADRMILSLAVLAITSLLTVLAGRMPVSDYFRLYKAPIIFLILGTVAIAAGVSLEPRGDVWVRLGPVYLYGTYWGIWRAVHLVLKALAAVSAMYFLALSTPAGEVVTVLKRLHVPGLIIELMNMIYRFIFVLLDTQVRMQTAAQSRLGNWGFRTSCRTFGLIGASLLVVSMKKAGAYYDALTARCYDGELVFLEEEKPVKRWQIPAAIAYFIVLLLLIWLTE